MIRHDLRHGNRPYHYRQQHNPLHYITSHVFIQSEHKQQQVSRLCRPPDRPPERPPGPWWNFQGIGGGDELLIQETARPCGRLPTGILRSWFSLYPTTRHYPFPIDHGAPPLLVGFGRSPVKAPLHGRFLEIDHDTGCGRLAYHFASSNRIGLSTGEH